MNDLFDLTGRKALVTGGTGAIGGAIAEGLLEAGAQLVLQGTTEAVHETAAKLGRDGPACAGLVADLTDRAQRRQLFDQAVERLGGLDILVLAHGTIYRAPAEDHPQAEWDRTIDLNLSAVFELSQLAARHMLPLGHGKIILIASVLSFEGGITVPAYAASKGGLRTLTMALCNDWASRGINVNGIAPGYIVSRFNAALRADAVRSRQILDRIPAGRWGQPDELKGAAIFLASRASDYVHGTILAVDGGWLAR